MKIFITIAVDPSHGACCVTRRNIRFRHAIGAANLASKQRLQVSSISSLSIPAARRDMLWTTRPSEPHQPPRVTAQDALFQPSVGVAEGLNHPDWSDS